MTQRLMITLEINVENIERAREIKLAVEAQAEALQENVKIKTRYDEYPNDN